MRRTQVSTILLILQTHSWHKAKISLNIVVLNNRSSSASLSNKKILSETSWKFTMFVFAQNHSECTKPTSCATKLRYVTLWTILRCVFSFHCFIKPTLVEEQFQLYTVYTEHPNRKLPLIVLYIINSAFLISSLNFCCR